MRVDFFRIQHKFWALTTSLVSRAMFFDVISYNITINQQVINCFDLFLGAVSRIQVCNISGDCLCIVFYFVFLFWGYIIFL